MDRKLCVLAVDDSAVNLATIKQKLKDTYEVVTINSGERAIRYLKTGKPDLILLDIMMDEKDGIETLKEIRKLENGKDIPVIMVTSKSDTITIIETNKLGIYDYVLKPFETEDLRDRILRALKKAREVSKKNKKN